MNIAVHLKKNEDKRLLTGHRWIFSNEIAKADGTPSAGDTVDVFDANGKQRGVGFYNPNSLIAVRMLSTRPVVVDVEFWRTRLAACLAFRRSIYPGAESFRLAFGESDNLPGLIVDKFARCCSVQFLSAGVDRRAADIVTALREVIEIDGIVARNDSGLRALEGLPEETKVLWGDVPERVLIEDGGCAFSVDLRAGQKTGFFFDQRENRQALARYCEGKAMLDCFCHTGAFGIHAAKAGASRVTLLDSSGPALLTAGENIRFNGVEKTCSTVEADALAFLEQCAAKPPEYDVINIDPPALVKNRKSFHAGLRLYRKLNTAAMVAVRPGGIVASSSCSHHVSPGDFRAMLAEAAAEAGRQVRLLEVRSQGRDHPVLLAMPETEYLKFAIMQVL